jgi:2-keto-3-deoxy-L-rhamnonate aldolase RhmA
MSDAGAGGSIPPTAAEKKSTVRTPEARAIVPQVKYPPIGNRGISGRGCTPDS